MSQVALSGNALGTGTFTIASPNSNTNRTLDLPDASGTILTTATPGVPVNGPAFSATFTGTSVFAATNTEMGASTEAFDTASAYSTTNGRFIPQVAGYYQVNASVSAGPSGVGGLGVQILKNGSGTVNNSFFGTGDTTQFKVAATSGIVFLNGSTDYASVFAYTSSGSMTATGYFSGALIRSTT
jgi:hypothetical protein